MRLALNGPVSTGSGYGLVQASDNPLAEPMMTKTLVIVWYHGDKIGQDKSLFCEIGLAFLVAITGTTILVPYPEVKSLQLIWRSGGRTFHLRVPDPQISCRDLTSWLGTRIVALAIFFQTGISYWALFSYEHVLLKNNKHLTANGHIDFR